MMRSKLKRNKGSKVGNHVQKATRDKKNEVVEISTESDRSDGEASDTGRVSSDNKQTHSNRLEQQQQVAPLFFRAKKTWKKPSTCVSTLKSRTEVTEVDPSPCQELDPLFIDLRLGDLKAATFPTNQVFSILRKKAGQHEQNVIEKDNESVDQDSYGQGSSVALEGVTKSSSSSCGVQDTLRCTPEKALRPNRLSRTRKLRGECGKSDGKTKVVSDLQSPSSSAIYQREPFCEDVLWTEKYRPVHSREVIGNRAAIEQLHSWLKKWKRKTDIEERMKFKETLIEEQSKDCWDCGDFMDEVGAGDRTEDPLCNTVLLTGPPGVGKTASVYACAMELGFKVFEVNCSSQRCGQEVLTQLKEATQSHLVETGSDPLTPAFFKSRNKVRRSNSDTAPVKTLKKAKGSTSKNRRVQNRSTSKKKENPVTLTSYFKTKAKADYLYNCGMSTEKSAKKHTEPALSTDQKRSLTKKMSTSLILFEEVDVIFEDDVGFLTAIKTLMTTTKRPIILTTTDPLFTKRFNGTLDEYFFQTPSMADVCSYLQLVCLAENIQLNLDDVRALFKVTRGDVRRCLLQLQLWANSGGGWPAGQGSYKSNERELNYKGCITNMLGLRSLTQTDLLQLLHKEQLTKLLPIMVESWRNGIPILYSNLESLLHVDANEDLFSELDTYGLGSGKTFSSVKQMEINCSLYPTRSAAKTKSRLSRKKNVPSVTTPCLHISSSKTGNSPKLQFSVDEKETSNWMSALSDFFDLMSFIDASMPLTTECLVPCQDFPWRGAKILDGQLDEMGEADENQEIILDIRTNLEALSFGRCKKSIQGQGTSLKKEPSPQPETQSLCCITCHLCPNIVHQRRFDLNNKVLSTRYFSLLHNRRAVYINYLPVVRFICRTHRKRQAKRTEELDWCIKSFRTELGLARNTVQFMAGEFS